MRVAAVLSGLVLGEKCPKMVKECKTVHTNEQNESVIEYHGDQKRTTKSGKQCRNWKEVEYIQDDLTDIDESDMQNFCRNPKLTGVSDAKAPWCFIDWTKEGKTLVDVINGNLPLYEECEMGDVLDCDEVHDSCLKNYRGTTSTTRCGFKCKCWSAVVLSDRPSDIWPAASNNHNYCRSLPFNGKAETHPWCYIDDPESDLNWDYCEPDFTQESCDPDDSKKEFYGNGDDAQVEECVWFENEATRYNFTLN